MKRLSIFLFLLIVSPFAMTQTEIFKWEEGMKMYIGTFDSKTNSQENLSKIYSHLVQTPTNLFEVGNVWTINQMDSSFLAPLDSVYLLNKNVLASIILPAGDFWKDLKNKRTKELEQFYATKRLEILSYTDPTVLLNKEFANCLEYAHALNGTDEELLGAWKKLHEEQKKNNGSPETLEARYLSELNSENSLLFAKFNVTVYGWWNCVNSQIQYVQDDNGHLAKEFRTLFLKTEAHFFED